MKTPVFLTSKSELTFWNNIAYLQDEWGAKVTNEFIEKVNNAIENISNTPHLYPIYSKENNIHKCIIVKKITLCYKSQSDRVDLIAFWNNYQNPNKLKI